MYRIQDSRAPHKKSVVHFDRLKPCKEGMHFGPMEKTSNVRGSFDEHKNSSGFNTRIQIIDDDDDNVGTNTPAVGEDQPPENWLLRSGSTSAC